MGFEIEKTILKHRNSLDVETPPQDIWDKIAGTAFEKPNKGWPDWTWKVAAAIFLVISATLLVLLIQEREKNVQLASLGDISEKYKKMENAYQQDITAIENELDIKPVHKKEFSWLFEELEYLEVVNEQYRKDIAVHPNNDQLIKALVDYYEKKLKILKRLQLEINRRNNEKESERNI